MKSQTKLYGRIVNKSVCILILNVNDSHTLKLNFGVLPSAIRVRILNAKRVEVRFDSSFISCCNNDKYSRNVAKGGDPDDPISEPFVPSFVFVVPSRARHLNLFYWVGLVNVRVRARLVW